jgi:hypothetical protein
MTALHPTFESETETEVERAARPASNELLLTCKTCRRAFWTGIIIPPALREEAGVPGDTYACPSGHLGDYDGTEMFYDRRSGDATREDEFVRGSVDRRQRARRSGEI